MALSRSRPVAIVMRVAALFAVLGMSGCGPGSRPDARVPSADEYRAVLTRTCVTSRQLLAEAAPSPGTPAVFLRRAAEAGASLQRQFEGIRPPARFVAAHRELLRLGRRQLRLIGRALARLQAGAGVDVLADLQARNRRLLQRSDEIAGELGMPECISGVAGR